MNVSSLTASSIRTAINSCGGTEKFLQLARRSVSSLLKTFDRIGTSIALGEAGDLEAAHAFRNKNPAP